MTNSAALYHLYVSDHCCCPSNRALLHQFADKAERSGFLLCRQTLCGKLLLAPSQAFGTSSYFSRTVVRPKWYECAVVPHGQFSFVVNSAEMGVIAPRLYEDQVSISCSTHTRKRSRSPKTFVHACYFATSITQCHHKLCVPGRHPNLHLLYVCWAITAGLLQIVVSFCILHVLTNPCSWYKAGTPQPIDDSGSLLSSCTAVGHSCFLHISTSFHYGKNNKNR